MPVERALIAVVEICSNREVKGHMKDNEKELERSLTALGFINWRPLCSLCLSPLNSLCRSGPLKPSNWASSRSSKRGRELGVEGRAWPTQEPAGADACWSGGRPCLPDVWRGPLCLHTGQHINPRRRHPLLVCHPLTPPHPPSSIHGRSFQQVIQRANKEASSFCPFWNVQCQKEGEGGRADSKKAYNLFTKAERAGPPILFSTDRLCWDSFLKRDKEKRVLVRVFDIKSESFCNAPYRIVLGFLFAGKWTHHIKCVLEECVRYCTLTTGVG